MGSHANYGVFSEIESSRMLYEVIIKELVVIVFLLRSNSGLAEEDITAKQTSESGERLCRKFVYSIETTRFEWLKRVARRIESKRVAIVKRQTVRGGGEGGGGID
jgi:hypothetical protein